MEDYLRTSQSITTETLLAAVGENIRFTIPDGWRTFRAPRSSSSDQKNTGS